MVTYLIGGFPASGKSTVAKIISEITKHPIITLDTQDFTNSWAKFLENSNMCILDMVFETREQVQKYTSRVDSTVVAIYVQSTMEDALRRNRERDQTHPNMLMLTYWLSPFHALRDQPHTVVIKNLGSLSELRQNVEEFLNDN